LNNPEYLTPRLLFELYTFNFQRTLFEKILNDKVSTFELIYAHEQRKLELFKLDDAIRLVDSDKSKKNRRRIGVDHNEEPDAINLDVFVEILNILDEELLNDNSFHELRRTWTPDEPIDQVIAVRHLVMWCCLFNRMELIDSIFESESLLKFDTSAIFEPNEPSGDLYNGFPNASLSSHVGLGNRVIRTKS